MHDVDGILDVISFLEMFHWKIERHLLGKLTAIITRRCLDAGLNRWEYYINMSETEADRFRKIWWKSLFWDRWSALMSGKPVLVSDEANLCLFPRDLLKLGARDDMTAEELLQNFECNDDFTNGITFYFIVLSKIITEVFHKILYNRKFTSYVFFSKYFENEDNLALELIKEYQHITHLFDTFRSNARPILDNSTLCHENFFFFLFYSFAHVKCLSAVNNVVYRFRGKCSKKTGKHMDSAIDSVEKSMNLVCDDLLLRFLNIGNPYHVCFAIKYVTMIMGIKAFLLVKWNLTNAAYNLTLLIRVVMSLSNIIEMRDMSDENSKNNPVRMEALIVFHTRICLTIRFLVQVYLRDDHDSGNSFSTLLEEISALDPEASALCSLLLKPDFAVFHSEIIQARKSHFHDILKQKFASETSHYSADVPTKNDLRSSLEFFIPNLFETLDEGLSAEDIQSILDVEDLLSNYTSDQREF